MYDAEQLQRLEAARREWLERARRNYFQKCNPLYAWEAVNICNLAGYPPLPLPQWCLNYVVTVAVRMGSLGRLNNPKTYPFAVPGETREDNNDRIGKWQRTKIRPAEAVAMLPWVLSVTRPGWNAFADHEGAQSAALLAAQYDGMPDHWIPRVLAKAEKHRNISPETVKRRIRRGRRVGKPDPLPPGKYPAE